MQSKVNRTEYLQFFAKWLANQFYRPSNLVRNVLLLREVAKIVSDDDEAAYWGDRDCWTMYDKATEAMKEVAIVGIEA